MPIPTFKQRLSSITEALIEELDSSESSLQSHLASQASICVLSAHAPIRALVYLPVARKRAIEESVDTQSTDSKRTAKKQKRELFDTPTSDSKPSAKKQKKEDKEESI